MLPTSFSTTRKRKLTYAQHAVDLDFGMELLDGHTQPSKMP